MTLFDKVQHELMALRSTLSGAPPVWEQGFVNTDHIALTKDAPAAAPEPSAPAPPAPQPPSPPAAEAPQAPQAEERRAKASPEADTVIPESPEPAFPLPPPMITAERTGALPRGNPQARLYARQLIEEAMASLKKNELHLARERLTEANRIDPGNIPAIALLSKVDRALG